MLDRQSAASLRAALAPKLGALPALAGALPRLPMAASALFSSVAALLGAAGQGNYAAANAALDVWAHRSQAAGGVARSVQWGAWASSGMASEVVLRRLDRIGQGCITAQQGLLSLAALLRTSGAAAGAAALPQLAVNGFLWGRYLSKGVPPFFEEFVSQPGDHALHGIALCVGTALAALAELTVPARLLRRSRGAVDGRQAGQAAAAGRGPARRQARRSRRPGCPQAGGPCPSGGGHPAGRSKTALCW